jgi:hypothetical protein
LELLFYACYFFLEYAKDLHIVVFKKKSFYNVHGRALGG